MGSLLDEQNGQGGARKSIGSPPNAVNTFAQLRQGPVTDLFGLVMVEGGAAIGDGLGGVFYWNPTDTTADNGTTIIRPVIIPAASAGRWNLLSMQASSGPTLKSLANDVLVTATGYGPPALLTELTFTCPAGAIYSIKGMISILMGRDSSEQGFDYERDIDAFVVLNVAQDTLNDGSAGATIATDSASYPNTDGGTLITLPDGTPAKLLTLYIDGLVDNSAGLVAGDLRLFAYDSTYVAPGIANRLKAGSYILFTPG